MVWYLFYVMNICNFTVYFVSYLKDNWEFFKDLSLLVYLDCAYQWQDPTIIVDFARVRYIKHTVLWVLFKFSP